MKFTPKHNDIKMRAIYGSLIVLAVAFMNIGTGIVHTVFMCGTVVCLCTGLFLFTRFEMTTFSYLVRESDEGLGFYVDKATGRRGAYVCFYLLKDCVALERLSKEKKREIQAKHGKTFFYGFNHNKFSTEKYIVVFQNNDHCDGIVCQLDEASLCQLSRAISIAKKQAEGNGENGEKTEN